MKANHKKISEVYKRNTEIQTHVSTLEHSFYFNADSLLIDLEAAD